MDKTPFYFGQWSGSAILVARIPSGLGSKRELLETLGHSLKFPDYYGVNWDAFEECIRDLSQLPEGNVVVRHEDLPLEREFDLARTYLSILDFAVEKWSNVEERDLIVVFPAHLEGKIAAYDWSDH